MWKLHKKIHHHVWRHISKHGHKIHHHTHHAHHHLLHLGEMILVWTIGFMSLMFASSSNLPNNTSFWYPLQKVSTVECRTLYRWDMPDSCKVNLPIIHGANYNAYQDNDFYRSIYTALRAAPYSDSWNQKIWAHAGVDIATARGTPLYSIGDGEIYSAGWNSAYGNVVKIKYVYQWEVVYAVYAHMDVINVSKWDTVTRWQKIGTVWNSWNTFGQLWWYHVHFEIDKDNYWRPAYSYLNCKDLDKWHYHIIQNGLCRMELFSHQYDPIKIFESNSTYQEVEEEEDSTQESEINESNNPSDLENTEDTNTESQNDNTTIDIPEPTTNPQEEDQIDKWNEVINNNESHNSAQEDLSTDSNTDLNNTESQDESSDVQKPVVPEDLNTVDDDYTQDNEEDPRLIELDFDWVKPLAEHFTKLRDIELRSELNERSLMLWETVTLDIEIFKKWMSEQRTGNYYNWVLQLPMLFMTNNDLVSIDVNYLQLITKWKAQIEITWHRRWKSSVVIEFGGKKIWVLDINVQ